MFRNRRSSTASGINGASHKRRMSTRSLKGSATGRVFYGNLIQSVISTAPMRPSTGWRQTTRFRNHLLLRSPSRRQRMRTRCRFFWSRIPQAKLLTTMLLSGKTHALKAKVALHCSCVIFKAFKTDSTRFAKNYCITRLNTSLLHASGSLDCP